MPQERIFGSGESIGAFKVVRLLGSGALGTVYEAEPHPVEREDLRTLGIHRVAVKVARLDALVRTPEERRQMVERLEREYRTLLGLMNPGHLHLPEVYELGWHEGIPFLVMEHIDGIPLADVLAQQPPMQAMLEMFLKLCAAVAVLHRRGVVHRDINPSNVLLCDVDPFLIDFSHCLPPSGSRITGADEFIGTPLYGSPQADAHALTPAGERLYLFTSQDDVWSLGVSLYEILTGKVPWRTPPHHREALVREMLQGPPRHPSDINPEVPRVLGDVAQAMLQPEPALRPRDAMAVLELLRPIVRAAPVKGRVPSRPPRQVPPPTASARAASRSAGQPAARGRGHKALAFAAVVLLALGLDIAGRWGLEVIRRAWGDATLASAPGGAKSSLPNTLPVPPEPLPGQMRAPCPQPYEEASGGCWAEIPLVSSNGKPLPCPSSNDYIRELKGKDGRVRCLLAIMRPTPTAEEPAQGKH